MVPLFLARMLLVTGASLVVTSALLVVTMFAIGIKLELARMLLVVRPGATSSVLVPSSKARSP